MPSRTEHLAATLMPLGELEKSAVRERARQAGLPVFDKPDSTGICFIGERPFREFLGRFLARPPGPIESPDGERARHAPGPRLLHARPARRPADRRPRAARAEQPWYRRAPRTRARNALIVVQGHDHPLLASSALTTGPHALAERAAATAPFACTVKVRYRQADQAATLEPRADGTARIVFETPQRAVTPGQYAVLYDGDRCLGGAVIETVEPHALRADSSPASAGRIATQRADALNHLRV